MSASVVATRAELADRLSPARAARPLVGLVPTMGALHAGHLSLVEAARRRCDVVVVSVFVNPTQFGPGEDFDRYPRQLDRDAELLSEAGVDVIFAPAVEEVYGEGTQVTIDPGPLGARWEGAARPGHFAGVALVVTKLFGIVRPDVAFFGEKDFQQLAVVRRLVADLDLGVEVVGCSIVRDADGLALSSRNAYLSQEERARALSLFAGLGAATAAFSAGERSCAVLESRMAEPMRAAGVDVDYAAVVDPVTLEPLETARADARAIVAGRVGGTRLIDNRALGEDV